MRTLRQYVDQRYTNLLSERSSWVSHWKDLSKNIEPRIGRFLSGDNNSGSKKNGAIINSTATYALRTLAAGLMTGLTSPARPWFKTGLGDTALNDVRANRLWLAEVDKRLLGIFRRSNIYQSLQSIYEEIGLGGTGCMMVEASIETVINTKTYTLGEYLFAIGPDGKVDTMYREFRKTVGQVVKEYGLENVSISTQNQYENDQLDKWVTLRQAIEPNRKRSHGSPLAKDKPVASFHWEIGASESGPNEGFLRRSGFDEFPIMGPRWDVKPSDIYGRSPAMDVLGDVKQLQSQERAKGKAIAKIVDPPMVGSSGIQPGQTNTMPGGFTSVVNVAGEKSFTPAYQINPNLADLREDMNGVENRIRRGMYEDLFLAISNIDGVRTATEIVERAGEKLLMLGPVIERLQVELLDTLISRTFNLANSIGIMPPAPPEIGDRVLEVTYISPLAQAQRAVATGGIERLSAFVGTIAPLDQNALDKFDSDKAVDLYNEALGAPVEIIRSDDQVAQIRQAREEAQQRAAAAQSMAGMVDSAKTLSEIDPAGNEIVNQIVGGLSPT